MVKRASIAAKDAQPVQIGETYGQWVVIGPTEVRPFDRRAFRCRCSCGTERVIPEARLARGQTHGCGCVQAAHPREYTTWLAMRRRCHNPRQKGFENYGGRGITICARWDSFALFFQDMGSKPTPAHSIERERVNEGYSPDNCRWATAWEQAQNRRPARPRVASTRNKPHIYARDLEHFRNKMKQ